ncbi:MAG TPA: carbamoyltransferase HypF [Caproicibacter sp.]|nr:carbamoyltransferase HypF [Caproicibacter sp.]
MPNQLIRSNITINGIVQGVGFRPFVYNLARSCRIHGWVNNFPGGVHIDAEGAEKDMGSFIRRLRDEAPPISSIDLFHVESALPVGYTDFEIRKSSSESVPEAYISCDLAVCEDCLREMNDPQNRRYRYPFINCTNCGPRFTITTGIPYDRINTTMNTFQMCEECAREYHDPADRRFHAQPVACRECGPSLFLLDSKGNLISQGDDVEQTIRFLSEGKIAAIKGLGGYHLACDAKNADAVHELRARKKRDGKPFALMVKNLETVLKYCFVSEKESELLQSTKRPIVLLDMKPESGLAVDSISPDNNKIGIMLPYTPLHYLLFESDLELLVMTSGNRSGEPIYYKDPEAVRELSGIADFFLTNNREIFIRTDDSVTSVFRNQEYIIRRSRGYVPLPIDISAVLKDLEGSANRIPSVLACGGELKNTFCLTKGRKAFLSHHIGDLENLETLVSFETGIEHFQKIFSAVPEVAAFDKHPDYLSAKYADHLTGVVKIPVQHHHAHIASCMVENNLSGRVIGVAYDGTGYGDDGQIWGGEFFVGDYSGFERQAHFEYVPLPGGEASIKEPWRMALSYLVQIYGEDFNPQKLPFLNRIDAGKISLVTQQIVRRIHTPLTSSVGRLFDAVSSLIGLCSQIAYEGQAAIRLERIAVPEDGSLYPYEIVTEGNGYQISVRRLISAIVTDVLQSRGQAVISSAFHRTVAGITLDVCRLLRAKFCLDRVVLSGGVFQNRVLLSLVLDFLEKDGFHVYTHSRVPANDGGLSLGQAAIAVRKYMEQGMEKNNE